LNHVIQLERVTKLFGSFSAISDVSLAVESGQAVSLLGPNGAGKTTSIAIMLGLQHPSTGKARLLGKNPGDAKIHEKIGVVLQNVSVPDRLTVTECLNLFRGFYPRPLPLSHLLAIAGLEEDAQKMAQSLSGGKTRRMQFALAMAGDPEVLFLDEPTVGMDVTSKRQFWDALREFVTQGKTLILTTHDLQEADVMTDRVVVMNRGRIIADAPPEQIKMEFGGRQVSFVASTDSPIPTLRGWAEVIDVKTAGRQVTVVTRDSDVTLRRLIRDNWDVRDITVGGGGLEEAFVRLTTDKEGKS
jgi:ABC-2 type transport system ATP-binding protein